MANVIYNKILQTIFNAYISGKDIRAILVMSDTTADTENDGIEFVDDITTLDESDDATYARVALANETVNLDDANDRAEFDADNISFPGLSGDGTRDYVGIVLYQHVNDDTDSPIIAFFPFASTIAKTSSQVDVPFDAEGIIQAVQG